MQLVFDFPVNPRYTFDNFVVCGGNRTAWQFVKLFIESPTSNLLYIFGPPGSGKTHLLQAAGCTFYDNLKKRERIPYISFKDVEDVYRGDYLAEQESRLGERFQAAPVLLIDDIHLMPDNPHLRVELWQLFNDFYGAGRKIAITGLRPPKELVNLDEHLISRLLWGLVAGMDISDDESRRLIMKKLADDRQVMLPDDVISFILTHAPRDIPSLGKALDLVNRYALATGRRITDRLAKEALDGVPL